MNTGQAVAFDAEGKLWAATTGGVFSYDLTADTYQIFHTRDQVFPEKEGLLSLNSTAIAVDPVTGDQYIGSDDGLVSIRKKSGGWGYSAEIAAMSDRPSRNINGFGFSGGRVYILTAFGVGVYNPLDSSFIESYFRFGSLPSNTAVRAINFWQGRVWIGTERGLVSAPEGAANLVAPDSWIVHPTLANRSVLGLAPLGDLMVVGTDSGAYTIDPAGNGTRRDDLPLNPIRLASNEGRVAAADPLALYVFNGSAFSPATTVPGIIQGLAVDAGGTIGVALFDSSFGYWKDGRLSIKRPNTPASNSFADLTATADGAVWCASGAQGLSRLRDGVWSVFNSQSLPVLQRKSAQNVWYVSEGRDSEVWASTQGGGAVTVKETTDGIQAELYDQTNSPLVGTISTDFVVVAKSLTDRNSRTWLINYGVESVGPVLLVKLRPEEESRDGSGFETFVAPFNIARTFLCMTIDENGTKWLGSDYRANTTAGLLYLNDRGTPTILTDDAWGLLSIGDNLLDNKQRALVVDRLGELWIGTPKGLQVLVNPSSVVNNRTRPVFRNIRAMADISITALEVDALNRKWVGTDQGMFLLSAEGDQVLARYTISNSPLANNQILSILAVDATGDIYIGTSNGLNRISTEAVEPRDGSGTLAVSPHPFVLPAAEPLRITGLPADATVKIFAQGMTLIREFLAPGGAVALWDGRDDAGDMVPSGVYIIAAGAGSGDVAVMGKVAVIRR